MKQTNTKRRPGRGGAPNTPPPPPPNIALHLNQRGGGWGGTAEIHKAGFCLPRQARSLVSRLPENKETAHNSPHLLPQLLFPARSQSFLLAVSPSPSFPGAGRRVRGELLALPGPAGLFGGGGRRHPRATEVLGDCIRGRDGLSLAARGEEKAQETGGRSRAKPARPSPRRGGLFGCGCCYYCCRVCLCVCFFSNR